MQDIRVVILAGGKGTRLMPYTAVFPKPLVPIGEVPILEILLRQLRFYGFRKVTLSVNHLAHLIQTFFGDGAKLGLEIDYCMENAPLGTAGSLSLVDRLTDPFVVMNGDLLTTINYAEMIRMHRASGADATIGAYRRRTQIQFGVLELDGDGDFLAYNEKPWLEHLVCVGVSVLNRSAVTLIPKAHYMDLPELIMEMKRGGKRIRAYQGRFDWLDIGVPEEYERALCTFRECPNSYLPGERPA